VGAETDPRLLQLAESISDRAPLDWDDARSRGGDVSEVVDGLARVDMVAKAFAAGRVEPEFGPTHPAAARWGQLEILEPLGRGAFGEVVRALDPILDREVALKLRPAGPGPADGIGSRLLDEARLLARIRHPNVVAVYGADLYDGRIGIWTELVEGSTLEQRLRTDGPASPGEAAAIGQDLCRALAAIHAAGLVHGDVKAANVIRERGGRIVLTDLGSATEAGAPQLTGSPATLAPEVLDGGPATAAADLYSLGLLLVRLLTGAPPEEASASRLRDLRPDLQTELVRVIERASDPDASRRFPTAGALAHALAAAIDQDPIARNEATDRTPRASRSGPVAWVAAAVTVVSAAALAWWSTTSPPTTPADSSRPVPAQIQTTAKADGEIGATAEITEPLPIVDATTPQTQSLEVRAAILRLTDHGLESLPDGSQVRLGDRLALELETDEPVSVWVINEDLEGKVFLLYPIDGLDLKNPLPRARRHHLPGRIAGVPQFWQVTSTGGREAFLVIASRRPVPDLDREIAEMAAADAPPATGVTRGVGALSPAALSGAGRLQGLVTRLIETRRRDGSVWLQRFELVNP